MSAENGRKNTAAKQLPLWLRPAVPTYRKLLKNGAPIQEGPSPPFALRLYSFIWRLPRNESSVLLLSGPLPRVCYNYNIHLAATYVNAFPAGIGAVSFPQRGKVSSEARRMREMPTACCALPRRRMPAGSLSLTWPLRRPPSPAGGGNGEKSCGRPFSMCWREKERGALRQMALASRSSLQRMSSQTASKLSLISAFV